MLRYTSNRDDGLVDRLTRCALPALGILALTLTATPALPAEAVKKETLEQRVRETARLLEKDPRFKGMTPKQIENGVEFVTGNTLFVLSHESGHALIREMGIPVLGREEDAADSFATITLLSVKNAFTDRVVTNAARGWFLSDQRDRKENIKTTYYDEHGIDLQRAYTIICLMVGGEPEKFSPLADEAKLPPERQGTCQGDYSNASWSWDKVLKPHLRAPDQPKTKVDVIYGPGGGEYDQFAELAKKLQILEVVADHLSNNFVWRSPIALEMKTCGSPNAEFQIDTKKIVVCYEIIAEFSQLYRRYGHRETVPGPMKTVLKNKQVVSAKPAAQKAVRSAR